MNIFFVRPELSKPYDPLGVHPHEIPGVGVFDEPTVKTCINAEWLSHLTVMIERLDYDDAWSGTEQEIYDAREAVRQIIAAFDSSDQGTCLMDGFIIGEIRQFAFSTLPDMWLACDGAAVSRTTYADLFAAIGTTFGAGNGTTTFNLPDTRGRDMIGNGTGSGLTARSIGQSGGAETHQLTIAEMPTHDHFEHIAVTTTSAGTTYVQADRQIPGANIIKTNTTGGNGTHNNMPPFLVLTMGIFAGV